MRYIELSIAAKHTGRRYYTYEGVDSIVVGAVVQVPFGKKTELGIVRAIVKKPTFKTKPITLELPFTLTPQALDLLHWMENFYPYDYGEISNLFIPKNALVTARQSPSTNADMHSVDTLPPLTKDQTSALKSIETNTHIVLHGDTGTGKTRVFLEYANKVLSSGRSVLVLTPEIGLTPQLISSIQSHCPYPVFDTHSQKTPAQRRLVWERANSTQPALFVGPRSSLFLPYNNLGLVVIDEAHDGSYNHMQAPKFNGLYVAAKLAKIHKATFIQSTATPNIADYELAVKKDATIVRMKTIAAGSLPSSGHVIDLTNPKLFTKHPRIADEIIDAITTAIANGEQSLIFLNRRGTARIIQCNVCGHVQECPTCGLPLTYHHDTQKMMCHICTYSSTRATQCTSCGSTDILYKVPGTKGLEEEIQKLFPNANIARFDLDVSAKDSIQRRIKDLKNGNIDIIIGTQVITKGIDLPSLSVVAVLQADSALFLPDFRSEEVAFQQLYQVTGRVGRGHKLSKFFIQTRQPVHPVIEAAMARNWDQFYMYELHKRKLYGYPPYSHIATVSITKTKQQTAQQHATKIAILLQKISSLQVLGPTPKYYERASGGFTWQLLLKSSSRSALLNVISQLPAEWDADIDPTSIM